MRSHNHGASSSDRSHCGPPLGLDTVYIISISTNTVFVESYEYFEVADDDDEVEDRRGDSGERRVRGSKRLLGKIGVILVS